MIDFCAEGRSLTAFAGSIRVSRQVLNVWAKAHPDFLEALGVAKAVACGSIEEDAKRVRKSGGGPGTAALIMFALRNFGREDYDTEKDIEPPSIGDLIGYAQPQTSRADEPGPATPRL